jgi:hypothetical protein
MRNGVEIEIGWVSELQTFVYYDFDCCRFYDFALADQKLLN